jgi:hypothetical protein
MKNFKYVSLLDFLSIVQAKTPYDGSTPAKKLGYCVGISCEEMFRMRGSKRKDKEQEEEEEEGKGCSSVPLSH